MNTLIRPYFRTRSLKPLERYTPLDQPRRLKRTYRRTQNAAVQPQSTTKSVRRCVWERDMGEQYKGKCITSWCNEVISVWTFQLAHNVARSLGGSDSVDNLHAMCAECNTSMGTSTLKEWNMMGGKPQMAPILETARAVQPVSDSPPSLIECTRKRTRRV